MAENVAMQRQLPLRLSMRERGIQRECRAGNLIKGLGGVRDTVNVPSAPRYTDLASEASDEEIDYDGQGKRDCFVPRDLCPPLTDREREQWLQEAGVGVNRDDEQLQSEGLGEVLTAWEQHGWTRGESPPMQVGEFAPLYAGEHGPSHDARDFAEDPLQLFWLLFPKSLVHHIAAESARYAAQKGRKISPPEPDEREEPYFIDDDSDGYSESDDDLGYASQYLDKHSDEEPFHPTLVERGAEQGESGVNDDDLRVPGFEPHEYAHLFGLMLAHMLAPRHNFSWHWAPEPIGAIAAGTFVSVMSEQRFDELLTNMHFSDNNDPRAKTDRVWKLRPLIDVLQDTFQRGYEPEPVLSFGEGLLPDQSRVPGLRKFVRHESLKADMKLYLTCCAESKYCMRFELYCGRATDGEGNPVRLDKACGPSAVLRNVLQVIPRDRDAFHRVTTGRYLTSIPLALELLRHRVNIIGKIQPKRVGYPAALRTRPPPPSRDEEQDQSTTSALTVAVSTTVPGMVACCLRDRRTLHILATGASSQGSDSSMTVVAGSAIIEQYGRAAESVDSFQELSREYSIQQLFKCKKYYQSVALGLLDCALANAYIIHREDCRKWRREPMRQVDFLDRLHRQLLQVTRRDMQL